MQNTALDAVSVIISAFNEAETIEEEIRLINEMVVNKLPGSEFIVAEDGSTDGTHEIITKLAKELGIIHSTSTERKGYAKALKDAFNLAKCSYIFFSDTGNKHDPKDFWELYKFRKDFGMVVGVKTDRKDQLYRKLLTNGYNKLLSAYFDVKVKDADSGFRIYQQEVVRKVFNENWINKELVASEILLRCIFSGYSVKEVPVSYKQRIGESRGLPLKKIPRVIFGVMSNMPKLKKTIANPAYSIRINI